MIKEQGKDHNILVTGGTSGLGLELVHIFLKMGYNVVSTGRQQLNIHGFEGKYTLYNVDFADLKQVAAVTKEICRNHSFSIIVNNAGILSPPDFIETIDGLECTFQINFLAHLLINKIILKRIVYNRQIRIASVTSPVYRYTAFSPGIRSDSADYRPMRSYSASKLYIAMMCEFLGCRQKTLKLQCFSFDPGTFSSGIYRMQKRWFREMYGIAAPFMRSPANVAKTLADLLLQDNIVNGIIYDRLKRQRSLPMIDKSQKEYFMELCNAIIEPFMN